MRELILADPSPSVPLVIPRKGRPDTELQANEVKLGNRRYIVCRNLVEAAQAARIREAVLATYHQTDAAIRGHVFCSCLALVLRKELEERLTAARLKPEWRELLADLDRLQEIEVEQDGKHFILRTPVTGVARKAFQAVGAALPPNIREADLLSVTV